MGTGDTRVLRSPDKLRERRRARAARVMEPNERDLSIVDPAGHQRYLGRPLFFGPLDPGSLDGFFATRALLEQAESSGANELQAALASLGLSSPEPWWHMEASFYQRHLIEDANPTPVIPLCPRGQRTPHGTPPPELIPARPKRPTATRRCHVPAMVAQEPPVTFEVFCEIAGAQAAWSSQGLDPAMEASRHFLLDLEELMGVELYWADELSKSRELARQFARKMLDYKIRFSGG